MTIHHLYLIIPNALVTSNLRIRLYLTNCKFTLENDIIQLQKYQIQISTFKLRDE